jgi:hypothetical protein
LPWGKRNRNEVYDVALLRLEKTGLTAPTSARAVGTSLHRGFLVYSEGGSSMFNRLTTLFLATAMTGLIACASSSLSDQARVAEPGVGYVDFYGDSNNCNDLWEIFLQEGATHKHLSRGDSSRGMGGWFSVGTPLLRVPVNTSQATFKIGTWAGREDRFIEPNPSEVSVTVKPGTITPVKLVQNPPLQAMRPIYNGVGQVVAEEWDCNFTNVTYTIVVGTPISFVPPERVPYKYLVK